MAHVIIDLEGAGLDTELTLYEGRELASMTRLAYNDDNPEAGTVDSRIGRGLSRGFYIVKGELKSPADATASKALTLTLDSDELIPREGHQRDLTVRYDPPPAADLPAAVRSTVVQDAAKAWNDVASGSFPFALICDVLADGSDNCSGRNADGQTVSVVVSKTASRANPGPCRTSIACVSFGPVDRHEHLTTMTMYIENPAWALGSEFVWTDNSRLDGTLDRAGRQRRYLYAVLMHEFGHTLGLDDLRTRALGLRYAQYLMYDALGHTSVHPLDLEYLQPHITRVVQLWQ